MKSSETATTVLRFGAFRLDLRRRLLFSAEAAEPVPTTSKAFDTLAYLAMHSNRVVEKAELMDAVWPNNVVEENNLNQVIAAIRRVLGERRGEHRFIATVPGRGYRFVAEVHAEQPISSLRPEATPPPARRERAPSIAVLPFANPAGDPATEYFGDGIAEELIHMLARVPGLRVPARTSSFAYKGRNVDVREIARDLAVSAVLEGSVRSSGERIRVTARLVDGKSGFQLWSESFDRRVTDIFSLQDELAGAIVGAVNREHSEASLAAATLTPPTRDVQAYQLYLQAAALAARLSAANFRRATALLNEAVARDPRFARAICLSAVVNFQLAVYFNGEPLGIALTRCEEHARQALVLDPTLAEAEALLGFMAAHRLRWTDAEQHYQRSFALATDAQALLTYGFAVQVSAGHLRAGQRTLDRALDLAPSNPAVAVQAGVVRSFQGHDAEASRLVTLAETLGWPARQIPLPLVRCKEERHAGRFDAAADYMMHVFAQYGLEDRMADVVGIIFAALADGSRRSAALATLKRVVPRCEELAPELPPITIILIDWAVSLGDLDLAFEITHRALDHLERTGAIIVSGMVPQLWLIELEPFRRDPRFNEVVTRLNLPEYWARHGPPDGYELEAGRLRLG